MTEQRQRPGEEGLFTWPSDSPQLIGGRCKSCGTYYFPRTYVRHRPDCEDRKATEEVLLSRKGELDSYTVQHYPPPPPYPTPDPFVPYAVGWVSLPEGIAVPVIITGCALEEIAMHMDVELTVEVSGRDADGSEVLVWKWRKV